MSALRHLRRQDKELCVWADAVCINQTDNAEKTAQLVIMDDVYREAETVLSWLGETSSDSSLAMEMIRRWATLGDRFSSDPASSSWLRVGSDLDEAFSVASTNAVNNLLKRPYWGRVWIQQEVALPQTVVMQCGTQSLPFEVFIQAQQVWEKLRRSAVGTLDMIRNWADLAVPSVDIVGPLKNLIILRQQQQQNLLSNPKLYSSSGIRFFDFLRSYQHLKATDPRDRVYGLLGIYSPTSRYRFGIAPDYNKTPQTVFCDVARAMIEDDCSFRPVALARNLTSTSPVTPLPSWVPDWTGTESLIPIHLHDEGTHRYVRNQVVMSDSVRFSTNGLILSVTGFAHGEVTDIQPAWASQLQRRPEQLLESIRNQTLPNDPPVLQAIFRIFSHHLKPWVALSEEQTDIRMTQAMFFLRFLLPSEISGMELAREIKALSDIFFGWENLAFLERVDSFYLGHEYGSDSSRSRDQTTKRTKEAIGHAFWLQCLGMVRNRVFFKTQGSLGLGPVGVDIGDVVFQPRGHCVLLILRPVENHFTLLGEGSIAIDQVDEQPVDEEIREGANRLQIVDIW